MICKTEEIETKYNIGDLIIALIHFENTKYFAIFKVKEIYIGGGITVKDDIDGQKTSHSITYICTSHSVPVIEKEEKHTAYYSHNDLYFDERKTIKEEDIIGLANISI